MDKMNRFKNGAKVLGLGFLDFGLDAIVAVVFILAVVFTSKLIGVWWVFWIAVACVLVSKIYRRAKPKAEK